MTRLRQIRQARGLTQLRVAADAGVALKTVQRIEQGRIGSMGVGTLWSCPVLVDS